MLLKQFALHRKRLGKHLKQIRESKGYSLSDLAAVSNLEKTAISRIENGRTNITFKTAIVLAIALEVKLKDVFDIDL